MPTATATADQTYGAVRIVVDFSDTPAATGCATTLVRVTPDGTQTPVRNSPIYLSGNQGVFWDDEAPLNTSVFYITANVCVTGIGTSSSVSVTGTGGEIGWLKDPLIPANDVPLSFTLHPNQLCSTVSGVGIVGFGDPTRPDADGEFDIINSKYPIITSMKRRSQRLDLTFVSLAHADILRVENILDSGRVLLLQVPTTYGWGLASYGSEYVHVKDVIIGRPSLQDFRHQQRVWTLPVTLTLAPADTGDGQTGSNGIGVGHSTYAAMKASGLTYAQLNATGKTYIQLAQGQGY